MAGIDIEIEIGGDLSAALARGEAAIADMTTPFKAIAQRGVTQTKLRFRNQRGPDGVPWEKTKRFLREGGMILILKGYLFGSIKEDFGPTHAAFGPENSGPSARYARIHQEGGPITPRGLKGQSFAARYFMPARPYLGWTEGDDKFATDVIVKHIRDAFAGGGEPGAGA